MFSAVKRFFTNHRRKFYFAGALVGGGYLVYLYIQKKLKEFTEKQEKDAEECMEHARRQHHFDSNQRTCNMTVLSMLPNVREALMRSLNTEAKLEDLKANPSNKLQIWEELKIMSVARTVSVIYTCSLMALLIRVQLNIVGGYIYADNSLNRNCITPDLAVAPPTVQEKYLSLIKYFLNQGVSELVRVVQSAVIKEVRGVSLKEKMSLANIQSLVNNIRERIECGGQLSPTIPTMPLSLYMLPPEKITDTNENQKEEFLYEKLVQETRDVIESEDFHVVLKSCLDRGFSKLYDYLANHYKQIETMEDRMNINETAIPLAKLVPVVNGLLMKLCSDAPNPYIQEILVLDQMKTLAANIYEAFSQHNTESKENVDCNIP